MTNAFVETHVLPATKLLRITWTQTNASTFVSAAPLIVMEETYTLIETSEVLGTTTVTINGVTVAQDDGTASWNNLCGFGSNKKSPGNEPCQFSKTIIVDTSTWSTEERTLSSVSASVGTLGFTWEDLYNLKGLLSLNFEGVEQGLKTSEIVTVSSSRNLLVTDMGCLLEATHSSTKIQITVPQISGTFYTPIGAQLAVYRGGNAEVEFLEGSGVTIKSVGNLKYINDVNGVVSLIRLTGNTWFLAGNLG